MFWSDYPIDRLNLMDIMVPISQESKFRMILTRGGHLRSLLSSIPSHQQFEYSFLLEDSREVSTVRIISPQLVNAFKK